MTSTSSSPPCFCGAVSQHNVGFSCTETRENTPENMISSFPHTPIYQVQEQKHNGSDADIPMRGVGFMKPLLFLLDRQQVQISMELNTKSISSKLERNIPSTC